ncbi:nickel pincer cofactor biosynthesis protein LarC [Halobacteria archaeon AArc-dxtr1]|nr:nickel pincer cofactor biosynthesis protein LarC [Halobacteria archaeon AArc-dxtr1]
MTVLAFDGRTGASGDMILATLLAAGADRSTLVPVEEALGLEYRVENTTTCGIAATTVDVVLTGEHDSTEEGNDHHEHSDTHHEHSDTHHEHSDTHHEHSDTHHDAGRDEDHVPAEGHGPHRSYREVREVVRGMELPADAERDALSIFELLGAAEASVHGEDIESIHFHEVGADDAIADVVGAALLLADLDPDRVITTPIAGGGGSVSMSHGEYPVPGPAVVEIATRADWSLRGGPVDRELLTPTGAAILGHVAEGVDSLPALSVDAVGYGAGGYDLDPHPNVLRAVVGEAEGGLAREEIAVLETNVDDVPPEILGGLQETLANAGARDVSVLPATMKKSRPGHLVKVICRPADRERVARRLAEETGTLGVRDAGVTHRWVAERTFETVKIEVGEGQYQVSVKVASDEAGTVYDASTEYDDAAAVARETGRPIREIARLAECSVADRHGSTGE